MRAVVGRVEQQRPTVGSEHPSKRKPDKHVVSGHSPVCQMTLV